MKRLISALLVSVIVVLGGETAFAKQNFFVDAAAAIVVNADTGGVIFSQNSDMRLPMASTTKIMTAVLLLENADLDTTVTATEKSVTVEGSSMGLLPGDKITYRALLYGLMLPSGNDAANTVAISLAGSTENFALMMNKKAAELKMDNTNFVTPSGLHDKMHYSTVSDMAKLAVYAMKNETFKKVVCEKSIRTSYGNPPYERTVFGHNKLLGLYSGCNGIKTGYTSDAGRCLVSSATRDGKNVIAVTLRDNDTVKSHTALLDFGFESLITEKLTLPRHLRYCEVISGTKNRVKLYAEPVNAAFTEKEREKLEYEVSMPKFMYADVVSDTTVGKITYTLNGKTVAVQYIKTAESVLRRKIAQQPKYMRLLKEFFII